PIIIIVAMIGAFSVSNNMINMQLVLVLGIVGYVLRKFNFSLASFLVGVVLGPLIEKYFMQGMFIGRGDILYFVASPIAAAIWVLVAVVIIGGFFWPIIRRARARRRGELVSAVRNDDND